MMKTKQTGCGSLCILNVEQMFPFSHFDYLVTVVDQMLFRPADLKKRTSLYLSRFIIVIPSRPAVSVRL